jgi:anaerobic ribonucleoside-triphosphate reductase activating protein
MHILNVAATCPATHALGPGLRSVVWVQGCAFRCPGCIAPDWIPIKPAKLYLIEDLVDELLQNPGVKGITFSGGEPMLQAAGLARLARLARKKRELDIICFTGFQRVYLVENPPGPGVDDLLSQVDVLIDGPYIARLDDNLGLRGSRNQKIHYLSNRLRHVDFDQVQRKAEIHILDGNAMLVGVPPTQLGEAYNQAINKANGLQMRLVQYERV